jgi:hypothetical protein
MPRSSRFRRQALGEGVDRALRGRVVEQVLAAEQRGLRAGVDDAAPARQVRQRRARHVEVAADVGLQRFLQVLLVEVLELFGVFLEGGVVDQDVEAPELLEHALDRAFAEARVLDVAGDGDGAAAFALDRAPRLARVALLGQVQHRDVGAFAREQHRDRAADAGVAAGDDRTMSSSLPLPA